MSALDLHLEDPDNSADHTVRLYSVVENYLQPKTTVTLQQTSASILALLPRNKPTTGEVLAYGEVCIMFGERIPYSHPLQLKLVGLMQYLQLSPHLSSIVEVTDSKVGPDQDGQILWNFAGQKLKIASLASKTHR